MTRCGVGLELGRLRAQPQAQDQPRGDRGAAPDRAARVPVCPVAPPMTQALLGAAVIPSEPRPRLDGTTPVLGQKFAEGLTARLHRASFSAREFVVAGSSTEGIIRVRLRLGGAVCAVLVFVVFAGSAAADQAASTGVLVPGVSPTVPSASPSQAIATVPAGAGWTNLPGAPSLANSHLVLVQGTIQADGSCWFYDQLTSTDAAPVQEDQVAVNDSLCQEVMQIGTPSASLLASEFGSSVAPDTTYDSATAKAWYTDCCGIEVSAISDKINWGYNGSCVVGGATGSEVWSWETSPFQWYVDYISTPPDIFDGCSGAQTRTDEYAAHGKVPGTSCTAYTTYDNAYVEGKANGSVVFGAGHSVTGCHPLFSYSDALQ